MRVKQALSPISQAGRRQQQQLRLPGHVQQDVKALIMAFIKQQHEKTGSQHENWKPYRTSKSPILLQDVPAVDASELQQALQGGALPPVKPSRRSPLAKALRAKQRREMPSLEDLELKQRRDGEMASYAWSYLALPGPTWVVDQAPSFEYVLRKYYRTASSDVIEAMLQSGEPLMEEAISKAWKSEMREHRSEAIRHSSLETLTVLIFLNGWYDVVYVVIMQALYIWKGAELPYPGSLSSIMALEVCLVFVLGVLEYCRLFLASRGNKTERYLPLIFSIVLALPCAYLFFYYLYQQLYVSRLDVIVNSIGLAFVGLELLLSLVTVFTLLKAPPPSQG
ncbi:putative transmembrane protein 216 [Chrysochromulina tobinii]|uniref:Putative transmembrane protein 216 n=1 Tax=Chrysochromulina tobinii TaxID=1460289 RepID=A0A0M0K3D3_9EUKA|nr:putative transmembrane protein 216 [Chrysochromulina tobinii]|eukprot:KOO33376.1 putative transmembrane protein 216 [Chrysochromulina sp. CCMP291]